MPGTPTASMRNLVPRLGREHVARRHGGSGFAIVDADRLCPLPGQTSMNPPPPMLPAAGYVTVKAKAVATAASTALPPRLRIATPHVARLGRDRHHHATLRSHGLRGTPAGPLRSRMTLTTKRRTHILRHRTIEQECRDEGRIAGWPRCQKTLRRSDICEFVCRRFHHSGFPEYDRRERTAATQDTSYAKTISKRLYPCCP